MKSRVVEIIFYALFCATSSWADSPSPSPSPAPSPQPVIDASAVTTREFTYQVPSVGWELMPRSTLLAGQAPIGILQYASNPFADLNFASDLSAAFAAAQTANSWQMQTVSTAQQTQHGYATALKAQAQISSQAPEPDPIASIPTGTDLSQTSADLAAFRACAQQSLPDLKRALVAGQNSTQQDIANAAWLGLNETRGNGSTDSSDGMICGKSLGRAGASSQTDAAATAYVRGLEEAKWLMALSARNGAEAQEVLIAFLASHRADAPPDGRKFWLYVWDRISFHAVFRPTVALPSLDSYVGDLLKTPPQQTTEPVGGITLVQTLQYNEAQLRAELQAGQSFAQALLVGLTP